MWLKLLLLSILCCNSILTTSIDVGGVLSGNRMAGVPLGRSLGDGELDVEGICAEAGMACQNCTHAVTCVPLPYGYLKVPLQVCSNGQTCNAHKGGCSEKAVPECQPATQKHKHSCEQVGIFPDAFDCRKFHLCSPAEGLPDGRPADHRAALCPRHYGYNPQYAQCSIRLLNGQCSDKPVPDCKSVGETGPLPKSPNHYYVCLLKRGTLHPQVFICPHGWYFWDGFCRPEPQETVSTDDKVTTENAKIDNGFVAETTTVKPTTSKIEGFFSTEKAATYAADTFLADRFDLSNYETTDDVVPQNDYANSFESGTDFW
ncbi:PREDICTED: uncharacterized protein LOC106118826 [Papilio xuthus]|uniref:Uncharacterized protein LOC106118826 n=1 Tax=Papilio xuthus TaxID=66420 RepID=A0AAJ6ZBH8_PAPXU|nr:PREDICTED: uncharacterized protein LOC106118826 [Papilio xuthus]